MLILVAASMPVGAALPGTNGKIAFVSQRDSNEEIYVTNADGTDQTRLTYNASTASTDRTAGRDLLPSFLPDGGRLAFTSRRPIGTYYNTGGGVDEIWVMDAEDRDEVPGGDNLHVITGESETTQHNFQSAFSVGGEKMIFTSTRPLTKWTNTDNDIWVREVDPTNPDRFINVQLTKQDPTKGETKLLERHPTLSADGTKVAFTRVDGNDDIWVMNADGTGQTNLTNNPANDTFANFSPDGTKIVFSSNRTAPDGTADSEIYMMSANGSNPVPLTNNGATDESPVFSPNGKQVAFTSDRKDPRDGTTDKEIYVMNAEPESATNVPDQLTNNSAEDSDPDWGPIYAWSGVSQPVNADGSSVFKAGSTVPVKFRLIEESAGIANARVTLKVTKLSDAISGDVMENPVEVIPTTGSEFRYDDESDQYIYNWRTKGLEPGTYKLTIDLGDGTAENPDAVNHVLVSLK